MTTTAAIRRAEDADAGTATAILADGFTDDPVMSWVFRTRRTASLTAMFGFLVGETLLPCGATYLGADCCAAWTPPGHDAWAGEGTGERFLTTMTDALDPADLQRLFTLGEVTEAAHPSEPHWYLNLLATRAAARGRGAGTAMLARTLAAVDADGLPAYLESTNPRNVTLYERHGFVVTGTLPLPDGGPSLTAMWRAPR